MKLNKNKKIFFVSMALLSSLGMSAADQFVSFQKGDLLINRDNKADLLPSQYSPTEYSGLASVLYIPVNFAE